MAGVRKRREYANPLELEDAIDEYFASEANKNKVSKAGLLIHLKLYTDRHFQFYKEKGGMWETLYDYAKAKICQWYEDHLVVLRNPTGPIFALKNVNSDEWKDVHTTENVKLSDDSNEAYKKRLQKIKDRKEVDKITRPVELQKKAIWPKKGGITPQPETEEDAATE